MRDRRNIKIKGLGLILLTVVASGCMGEEKMNHLAKEKSPYLLQHATNPVDWYPWGEEAFVRAKEEDKPIFLSIGYSTCHWCHVMEEESFSRQDVADILNANFVSIKVDREERPDIDTAYMKAVMALTGNGGWPLNVVIDTDGRPFFGGTYFPREDRWGRLGLKNVLKQIAKSWKEERAKLKESADTITQVLLNASDKNSTQAYVLSEDLLRRTYKSFAFRFDSQDGGFGNAPKFPTPHNFYFLLRFWRRTNTPEALEMVEKTLSEMARGGIYDHLGGGFHRYSTDKKWLVPHFEKMLYDQALISRAYWETYQATGKEEYAQTARGVFDYVLEDMMHSAGGFYSAEDADSIVPGKSEKKKEGAFYVWGSREISRVLDKKDAEIFFYVFDITDSGNVSHDVNSEFYGKNIFHIIHSPAEAAKRFKKTEDEISVSIKRSKDRLLRKRSERIRPHLDDKILADWNGLMISSLAFGGRVLKERKYIEAAEKAAKFILSEMISPKGHLWHRYREGEVAVKGILSDYAFFIQGLIDLYEATFDVFYLERADRLASIMIEEFWDKDNKGFFLVSTELGGYLGRQKEARDGAIPSGNSVAAMDLLRLSRIMQKRDLEVYLEEMWNVFSQDIDQSPASYTFLLSVFDFVLGPGREFVIASNGSEKETEEILNMIYSKFIPNSVVVVRPYKEEEKNKAISIMPYLEWQNAQKGKTTTYVCENFVCKLPATDKVALERFLSTNKDEQLNTSL